MKLDLSEVILGIDPHKLQQADSIELTKVLKCAIGRTDDQDRELKNRD